MTKSIQFLLFYSILINNAFGWGAVGHTLIATTGTKKFTKIQQQNCSITSDEIINRTNEPDEKWKSQKFIHPHEPSAHYFHLDQADKNWKEATNKNDQKNGFLVYRVVDFFEKAKEARKSKKSEDLKMYLVGLSHYLGDLTQPLHLHHDHDGVEFGIKGIHSQYETKMVSRYKDELTKKVHTMFSQDFSDQMWANFSYKDLIFKIAEQTSNKAPLLLEKSKKVLSVNSPPKKKKNKKTPSIIFVKEKLWNELSDMTAEQMNLGSALLAYTLDLICR